MASRYFLDQKSGASARFLDQVLVVFSLEVGSVSFSAPDPTCYVSSAKPTALTYNLHPLAEGVIEFYSSNPAVAEVDPDSEYVIGYSPGEAIISVVIRASGAGMAPVIESDSFSFSVIEIPNQGYTPPSGDSVGAVMKDGYVPPLGTDVGFNILNEQSIFEATFDLQFSAEIVSEHFYPVVFEPTLNLGIIAQIQATGIGNNGVVEVAPINGQLQIIF